MPTREQQRAGRAYETIEAVSELGTDFKTKYGSICLKMPAMIQQNGLCQAISFYEAKAAGASPENNERARYLRDLSRLALGGNDPDSNALGEMARTDELDTYLLLSRDVMQCAVWLKRYAEAVLKMKPGTEINDVGGQE